MSRCWWISILGLASCGPIPEAEDNPFGIPHTGLTPCDTGCEPAGDKFFDAENIFIAAQFGYDAPLNEVTAVETVGYPIPPTIEVYLATQSWQNDVGDINNYCYIVLPLTGGTEAPWAQTDPRLYWGVDYSLSTPAFTNCNDDGYALDPEIWGGDQVVEWVERSPDWGIAVGDPSPLVNTYVVTILGDDGIFVLGGHMKIPSFLGSELVDVYGFAYDVDADMTTVDNDFDGTLDRIPRAGVPQPPGTVRRAWYNMHSLVYWTVQ